MKKLLTIIFFLFTISLLNAQQPNLMLPIGHTNAVNSAAYSPDGKYIVTASNDYTAKIWDAADGKLLKDLKGHFDNVVYVRYSPDSKYILTSSYDSTAKVWDAMNGNLLRTFKLQGYVYSANYSPVCSDDSKGGKNILTACSDSTARIWNATDGKLVLTIKSPGFLFNAKYSPNGKSIITTSADSVTNIWDAANGKLMTALKFPGVLFYNALFSPACPDDPEGGKYIITACSDRTIKIWNTADGKLIRELDTPYRVYTIYSPSYSPDGKNILAACSDGDLKIWNAADGKLVHDINLQSHFKINAASYSPDGKKVVSACLDNAAQVCNVDDGKVLLELKGHNNIPRDAVCSPDNKYLVIATYTSARIWNLKNGKQVSSFNEPGVFGMSSAVFSPACADDITGGKYILTGSYDSIARIRNAADGKIIFILKGHTGSIVNVDYSPDGKNIVTASSDSTAIIWDAGNGKIIRQLKGHTDGVRWVKYSSDGNYIITASNDQTARIWNAADGKLIRVLEGCSGTRSSAFFSPNGKYILTATVDQTAKIWNAANGQLVREIKEPGKDIRTAIFSPDSKYIVSSSFDNTARIWNVEDGKLVKELKGLTHQVYFAFYSADGKNVITNSMDNITTIWDSQTGESLYSFVMLDSTDYLTMDRDGHYDGSEGARKMLYYTCGIEAIELEQIKDLSWEPGLVSKIMGTNKEAITAKKLADINICNYTPQVEEKGFNNGVYQYQVTPRSGGVGEVQLFVNGKQVKKYDPSTLTVKNNSYQLSVNQKEIENYFISGANNEVLVKATTKEGTMSSRGIVVTTKSEKKITANPNMYVVSIGISNYKGDKLKLSYASKDATEFAAAVIAAGQKLLNTDGKQHVSNYVFNTETGSQRWPAKASIEKTMDSIAKNATADDILIIFFAGHGVLKSGQKNLYLLTAEATSFEQVESVPKEVSISTDELNEWMRKIKASKQVLILDACNSGQAVKNLQELIAKRDVPADQQRALENLKDKTGTFILSASASGQSAYETSLYGQGLLTYSLLSGIKLGDGLKDNKYIDVTKWFNTAAGNVQILAKDIGGRQDPQIIGSASFDVGLVDQEVVNGIKLSIKKKIFSRSRLIGDEDALSDELNLSGLVDKELNNLSARGKESPLAYVADNTMLDTYSVRGKYEITNNGVIAKVSLYKGQKERVYQFEMSGIADKKEELAGKIVQEVQGFLNK